MHHVRLYRKKYQLPSTWHEIPLKKLLKLTPLILAELHTRDSFRYTLLTLYIKPKVLANLPDEYLQSLLDLLSFTTNTPFKPILPPYLSRFATPHEDGEHITLFQLAYSHFHLRMLDDETKVEKAVNEIFFTLCPKRRSFVILRNEGSKEPTTRSLIERYANKVNPLHKLLIVTYFITHLKTNYHDRYCHSGRSEETEEEKEDRPISNFKGYGYFPLIYNLAQGGKPYGTYEQTCNVPASTVFFNLHISQ